MKNKNETIIVDDDDNNDCYYDNGDDDDDKNIARLGQTEIGGKHVHCTK